MRGRPRVQLLLRPAVARVGAGVTVEAVLTSSAATPVRAIELTLRGLERVVVPSGHSARREVHQHVGRRATFGPRTLGEGEHRVETRFRIPDDAPASYRGARLTVEYEVEVHVAIPWWLDRRARFVIPVVRPSPMAHPPEPRVFATSPSGPRGKEVYVECSLDDVRMEPGAVVTGAVSFSHVSYARISHVELAFVSTEVVRVAQDREEHRGEGSGWVAKILARAPEEGEAIPFRLKVPSETPPSFTGALSRLEWRLVVVGHVPFGRDVRLEMPIEIRAPFPFASPARRLAAAPPVGRERRARVWAGAAEQLGLESDPEREEMRASFGAASVLLRLEHREGVGLLAVAELSWAALASALEVRERRWTDAFGGKDLALADPRFDERFHVTADDQALAKVVLDARVRAALAPCTEAHVDDEGASLARAASVQSAEALAKDLAPVLAAARALGEAVARAPAKTTAPYR